LEIRNHKSTTLTKLLVAGIFIGGLLGCGGPNDRAAVSGEVKLADGQSIAQGVIEFSGLDQTLVAGATIEGGKYYVPREKGLKVGRYRVRINAPEPQANTVAPDGFPGEFRSQLPKELIPPRYNRDSEVEVTVPDTSDQTFNLTIETN